MPHSPCPVPTCNVPVAGTGVCNIHKAGWVERQIIPGMTPCHIWEGFVDRHGYGQVSIPGFKNPLRAHRAAYMYATGEDITGVNVRHPQGIKLCINRDHLLTGTLQDSMDDAKARGAILTGEDVHFSTLTETQVVAIREQYAQTKTPMHVIADEYGVSKNAINALITGHTWASAGGPTTGRAGIGTPKGTDHYRAKLTEDDVRAIRRQRGAGSTLKWLADTYGLSQGTITALLSGRTWKHVV